MEFACWGYIRSMTKTRFSPGLKLMLIGGLIMVAGIAGLMATPMFPGSSENTAVLLVLLVAVVGGGVVCLIGTIRRLVHQFKTTGLLGVKPND